MALLLGIPLWSIGLYSLTGLLAVFITYTVVVRLNRTSVGETVEQGITEEVQQEISLQEEKVKAIAPSLSQEANENVQLIDQTTSLKNDCGQISNDLEKIRVDLHSIGTDAEQVKADQERIRADQERISADQQRMGAALDQLTANYAIIGANMAANRAISEAMCARLEWVIQELARRNAQNSNQPPQANISGAVISPQEQVNKDNEK
jgi:chromosome segregation ATPase